MTEVKPVMTMRLIHGKTYEVVFERGVVFAAKVPTIVIVDEVRGDPSKLGPCGIDACCCDSVQRPDNVEVKKSP